MKKKIIISVLALAVLLGAAARQQEIVRFIVQTLPSVGYEGDAAYDPTDDTISIWDTVLGVWQRLIKESDITSNNKWPDYQANYISNVGTFNDSGTLTDGTGGTPDVSVAAETASPLSRSKNLARSYILRKPAGGDYSEQGWSFTYTLDNSVASAGRPVFFKFIFSTSALYDAGDYDVWVYHVGSNQLFPCNGSSLGGTNIGNDIIGSTSSAMFACVAYPLTTDTAVRFIINNNDTANQLLEMKMDEVFIGPDAIVSGSVVVPTQSYTPTWTGTSTAIGNGSIVGRYWVKDDRLYGSVYFKAGSTTNFGSGGWAFSLPPGYTIDPNKLPSGADNTDDVGSAYALDATGNIHKGSAIAASTADTIYLGGTGSQSSWSSTVPFTWAQNDWLSFNYDVPIEQYTGSALVSTTQIDFTTPYVRASGNGGGGLTAGTNNIDFTSEVNDDHNLFSGGTTFTVPVSGEYKVEGFVRFNAAYNGNVVFYVNGSGFYIAGPGNGAQTVPFGGTLKLTKGSTLTLRADTNSTLSNSSVHFITIKGLPSLSTYSILGRYQYASAECSGTTTATTGTTIYDVTGMTIPIDEGTWNVCYQSHFYYDFVSGSTPSQSCHMFLRDSSNNKIDKSTSMSYAVFPDDNANIMIPHSGCGEITTATTTNIKLSIECASSAAIVQVQTFCVSNWTGSLTDPDTEPSIWGRKMK